MANYKTGAQRYNDRMDKIFKRSEEAGHHTLHGSTEKVKKSHAKEKALAKHKQVKVKTNSMYQGSSKDWHN